MRASTRGHVYIGNANYPLLLVPIVVVDDDDVKVLACKPMEDLLHRLRIDFLLHSTHAQSDLLRWRFWAIRCRLANDLWGPSVLFPFGEVIVVGRTNNMFVVQVCH